MATTFPELVRPIFIFVVAFRRRARRGVPLQYGDVKREILALFARVEAQATAKSMTDRWSRAKTGLVYLVDEIAIMDHGRILDEGSPQQLVSRHLEPEVVEIRGGVGHAGHADGRRLGLLPAHHDSTRRRNHGPVAGDCG